MLRKLGKGNSLGGGSPHPAPLSIIGADVRIVGDIITQGEIQIDGQLEGDIACHTLVVGESARIQGEVTADTVRIHGHMDGKIIAKSVTIARTARVVGDITHETVEIEAGAQLEGHLIRKTEPAPPPALAAPAPLEITAQDAQTEAAQ